MHHQIGLRTIKQPTLEWTLKTPVPAHTFLVPPKCFFITDLKLDSGRFYEFIKYRNNYNTYPYVFFNKNIMFLSTISNYQEKMLHHEEKVTLLRKNSGYNQLLFSPENAALSGSFDQNYFFSDFSDVFSFLIPAVQSYSVKHNKVLSDKINLFIALFFFKTVGSSSAYSDASSVSQSDSAVFANTYSSVFLKSVVDHCMSIAVRNKVTVYVSI